MKKDASPIVKEIKDLICKINKQWGHKHLYNDYKVLIAVLEENRNLSMLEVSALDEIIGILQDEANRYSIVYPKWAARCLDCATELISFLPSDYEAKEERVRKSSELLASFLFSPLLLGFVYSDYYKKCVEDATQNNIAMLWKIALNCFSISSEGRRPRSVEEEYKLHGMMKEGYRLANTYLCLSCDYSHFSDWFSNLSPSRTNDLIEESSNYYERTKRRWYDKIPRYFEEILDMQLSLLWKWLDGDAEGFVNYWGADKIEELLELVEDDVFFEVLHKLCSLKNSQEVMEVLSYYAKDDESHVKNQALKLLADYHQGNL